jgi:hypothetical protein
MNEITFPSESVLRFQLGVLSDGIGAALRLVRDADPASPPHDPAVQITG